MKAVPVLLSICIGVSLLASCFSQRGFFPTGGQSHRTATPESTRLTYGSETPIANEVQAVTAARSLIATSRMESLGTPEVVAVERLPLVEAKKEVEQHGWDSFEGLSPDSPVWLVVFEGAWQIHPPDRKKRSPHFRLSMAASTSGSRNTMMATRRQDPSTVSGFRSDYSGSDLFADIIYVIS